MSDKVFNDLLTMTATIYNRTAGAVDDWGVPTETLATGTASEACLIQQLKEALTIEVKGKKAIATYRGYFKNTATLALDDIIEVSSIKYQVIGISDAAGQGHHKELLLRGLENG